MTAGCPVLQSDARRGVIRSAAMMYCVRAFVPIEKEATCGASRSAVSTAAGVSIMMPSFGIAWGIPALLNSAARRPMMALVRRISSRSATIGSITQRFPWAARPQQRAQLRLENFGTVKAHPDAAPAEKRVFFFRQAYARQRLVAP